MGNRLEVPTLFDSFMFTKTEQWCPTYKRELCALVRFCVKYDYLLRNLTLPGIIHTDHKPLVRFLKTDPHEGIYAHWATKLRELCLEIAYIPGP